MCLLCHVCILLEKSMMWRLNVRVTSSAGRNKLPVTTARHFNWLMEVQKFVERNTHNLVVGFHVNLWEDLQELINNFDALLHREGPIIYSLTGCHRQRKSRVGLLMFCSSLFVSVLGVNLHLYFVDKGRFTLVANLWLRWSLRNHSFRRRCRDVYMFGLYFIMLFLKPQMVGLGFVQISTMCDHWAGALVYHLPTLWCHSDTFSYYDCNMELDVLLSIFSLQLNCGFGYGITPCLAST